VNATVVLTATKGRETYQLQQAADRILVEVRPTCSGSRGYLPR
jgi:hypothetical protein